MQKFFLSLVALSLVTVLGCTEIITVDANPQNEDQITSLYDAERLGPPAYALPHERFKSGKADANDDIRAKNPEYYAITEAPKLDNWRHMTEWEPMTTMVFTLS
ncbi:MAG TPA: hypothetical protein EYN66_20385, partial [Myxococcales bacterium]|nr:hypothetical protein [Myxococcales bacterium]